MRFRVEPNLNQLIHRAEKEVDPEELRTTLNAMIREMFRGGGHDFSMVPFPAGPYEIPDEVGEGRPFLVVLNYDALAMSAEPGGVNGDRFTPVRGTDGSA